MQVLTAHNSLSSLSYYPRLEHRPPAVAVGDSFEQRTGPRAPAASEGRESAPRRQGGSHGQEHRGTGRAADAGHRLRRRRASPRRWPPSSASASRAAAREGRPLRVYCGFDPRTADLHLGHTVPLAKLRQFQDLGHEVTVVVGTFTSLVGDPSDKREGRELMRRDEVRRNGRTYAEQAFRILDPARTRVAFNDEWLSRIGLEEFAGLASRFTVQQLVGRDNFRARWDRGEPIQLQETFYPILQARDACELRADVQVGGSDQLFNIVTASRRLMEASGLAPTSRSSSRCCRAPTGRPR